MCSFENGMMPLDAVQLQGSLSGEIEDHCLRELLDKASLPDKTCLLTVSSPHTAAWLSVIPSFWLNLHLDPAEFQTGIKWWLGIAITDSPLCPFFPSLALAPLGHHASTEEMLSLVTTDTSMFP